MSLPDRPKRESENFEKFPSFTRRRKLLILALAVATAGAVLYGVLERPGGLHGPKAPPAAPAPPPGPPLCGKGQTRDCVGGQIDVIQPAAPPSAAPR